MHSKKAEEEVAVAREREAFERLKAETQTTQATQTTQTTSQTTNVTKADEQSQPAKNTQTQPARQQTQTPVQTTQAPVETRNVGGVNLAGRAIEIPTWIKEQLVAEGLGVKYPDGEYGPARGKLMEYSNRLLELMKKAGLQ